AFLPASSEATSPAPSASNADPTSLPPAGSVKTVAPEPEFVDQTEVCSPPECSVDLPVEESQLTANASATVSLKELGYGAPIDHEMYAFSYDSAVAYLGPHELLFTFNPHLLLKRSKAEAGLAKLHTIRAVLMDLNTKKVVQTVDWRVHDARQYLWPAGPGR